jgi:hypothetical protein
MGFGIEQPSCRVWAICGLVESESRIRHQLAYAKYRI